MTDVQHYFEAHLLPDEDKYSLQWYCNHIRNASRLCHTLSFCLDHSKLLNTAKDMLDYTNFFVGK